MLTTVGTEAFFNLRISCVLSGRRRRQGCIKKWSRLNGIVQAARKKGDTFETRGRPLGSSEGPDRMRGSPALVLNLDDTLVHSSDFSTVSIWRLPWVLIPYLEV